MMKKLLLFILVLLSFVSFGYSAPYEIDTYTYDNISLDLSSQAGSPYSIEFNNDGTKMYKGVSTGIIYQYTCSTAYKVDTCSYASLSKDVSAQDIGFRAWTFNNDGTKGYMTGALNDKIFQYTCSTAYKIDTCSYASLSKDVNPQASTPWDWSFNNDGTKGFVIDQITADVFQYTCSTAYKIDTCSYASISLDLNAQSTSDTRAWTFNNDGTKGYLISNQGQRIYQYDCSSSYTLNTCSYNNKNLSVNAQDGNILDWTFNNDGTKGFLVGFSNKVYQFSTTFSPNLEYTNITANNISLNNSVYDTNELNFATTVLNTSTNANVNQTYYLYNSSGLQQTEQFATNNLNGTFTLNLLDGNYNISFFAINDETNTSTSNYSFSVDTTPPTITNNIPNTTDSYLFNGSWFSCDDLNLDVCQITIGIEETLTNPLYLGNPLVPNNDTANQYCKEIYGENSTSISYTSNGLSNFRAIYSSGSWTTIGTAFDAPSIDTLNCIAEGIIVENQGVNFNISFNGNNTYILFANDTLGNEVEEYGQIFVNPINYIYFQNNVTSLSISNFFIDDVLYSNVFNFSTYDYGIGTHNVNFTKSGFINQTISFDLNRTNQINRTDMIDPVTLFVEVFDASTLTKLMFNVTIEGDSIISYTNLNNLSVEFSDLPSGALKFTISSTGYAQGVYYTALNEFSSISFDVYLTPLNDTSVITFTVLDFNTNLPLQNVLVEARQVINDSKVTVQQSVTSSIGVTYMYLDQLKDYEFVFSKDGYVLSSVDSIPTTTTYTVKLKPTISSFTYIDNVNYRISPLSELIIVPTNTTFKVSVVGTGISLTNVSITDQNGTLLYSAFSLNPTGTTFTYTEQFLNTTNITDITVKLTYIVDGQTKIFSKQYKIQNFTGKEIQEFLDLGKDRSEGVQLLKFFIILTTFVSFIITAGRNEQARDYISIILIIPVILFTWIGWISYLYGTLLALVLIILFMGANKR